jgi:hypothetical protein
MRQPKSEPDSRASKLTTAKPGEEAQPYTAESQDYSGGKVVSPHTEAIDHGAVRDKRPDKAAM